MLRVHRLQPDSPVRGRVVDRVPAEVHRRRADVRGERGAHDDVRDGGHDTRRPEFAEGAVHHRNSRRRQARVCRRHGWPRDRARRDGCRPLREIDHRRARRRRRNRLARPPRPRLRRCVEHRGARGGRDAAARRRARHRRAMRQHANRSADGEPRDDGVHRSRSHEAAGVLPRGRPRLRRAHCPELSGDRRRCVPHRDRRARGRGREGVPQRRSRADGRGLRRRSRQHGRPRAGNRSRPDVGAIERRVLAGEARPAGDR